MNALPSAPARPGIARTEKESMKSILIVASLVLSSPAVAQSSKHAAFFDVQRGEVRTGKSSINFSTVTLLVAGHQPGSGALPLAVTQTDESGRFVLKFQRIPDPNAVYYIIADGPRPTTRLAAVLGHKTVPGSITINEASTIATAYAMAQFIDHGNIGGKWPGLQNAAATFNNLVDIRSGNESRVIGTAPNGKRTDALPTFNSLANALAGAVRGIDTAAYLLVATPPGGTVPTNTLDAAVNIAHNSWHHVEELFDLSQDVRVYKPALDAAPVTWTIALKYTGNGHEFDGPGAPSFDAAGNAWINQNYVFRQNHQLPSCGGKIVTKLTPWGEDFPGAPYNGAPAGVDGAGFGIAVDPFNRVWLANFGFFGTTCPCEFAPHANSVSLLSAAGAPISPATGYTQGCINAPQGIVPDPSGSMWIANTCGGSITRYINGNPNHNWVFDLSTGQLAAPGDCPASASYKPFGVAIDAQGNGWVALNLGEYAVKISPAGTLLAQSEPNSGIKAPFGVAIDSIGDVWIANSGILHPPCATCGDQESDPYGSLVPDLTKACVTKLDTNGAFLGRFTGGGIYIPWGIAVDGDDNIWVANFGNQTVSAFHGDTGNPIAPLGFRSDALMRSTAVAIDPSGNVWLTNNWVPDPAKQLTNPGGDGMVVFIGLASPVKTPLVGPVRKP